MTPNNFAKNGPFSTANKLNIYQKGKLFELFTMYLFSTDFRLQYIVKNIYLFKNIPKYIKDELKFPRCDNGIDILIETHIGEYIPIQCKFHCVYIHINEIFKCIT